MAKTKTRVEFSKKLAVFDIVIYSVLMIALIIAMIIENDIASYCVNAMTSVSTVYTAVRLGYSAKAGVENVNKIRSSFSMTITEENDSSSVKG